MGWGFLIDSVAEKTIFSDCVKKNYNKTMIIETFYAIILLLIINGLPFVTFFIMSISKFIYEIIIFSYDYVMTEDEIDPKSIENKITTHNIV